MITKELIILARVINELDSAAFETLENRIGFQKRMYLLQIAGLDLGYHFGWDLYGPYSKSLAEDASLYEEKKDEVDEIALNLKLSKSAKEYIEQAKQCLMKIPDGAEIKESTWLELISSLHYLVKLKFKTVFLENDSEKIEEINNLLFGRKPHLEQHKGLIDTAWANLWSCSAVT